MSQKTIYRRVFHYEVLSEYAMDDMSLEQIAEETSIGHMSGRFLDIGVGNERLRGKEAVDAILEQGTDPEFFLLDREGNDID